MHSSVVWFHKNNNWSEKPSSLRARHSSQGKINAKREREAKGRIPKRSQNWAAEETERIGRRFI